MQPIAGPPQVPSPPPVYGAPPQHAGPASQRPSPMSATAAILIAVGVAAVAVVGVAVVCILAVTLLGSNAEQQFSEIPMDEQGTGGEPIDIVDVMEVNAEAMQLGLATGQYQELYDRLHPEHQARVSREQFMRCADSSGPGLVEALGVTFGEAVREPQTAEGVDAYSVPVEMAYVDADGGEGSWSAEMHLVELRGTWWWLADLSSFGGGACPQTLTLDGPG